MKQSGFPSPIEDYSQEAGFSPPAPLSATPTKIP